MRIVLLVALSVLTGCATAPQTQAPAPVGPAPPAPPASTTAATAATPAAAPIAAANAANAAEDKFTPPAGYKARVENGNTLYCRKVTVLGSRFPKDVCMTEAQLRDQEANNSAFGRDKDQASRICAGGGSCQAN